MHPVLSPQTKAELDASHPEPVSVLMERAGTAVAREAVRMGVEYGSRVTVVAGPGNNGGDGYVAARVLRRRGVAARVLAIAEPKTDAAADAADRCRRAGVPVDTMSEERLADACDLLIDAGFGGRPRAGLDPAPTAWNAVGPVLAVDVPTGLDPTSGEADQASVRADRTVTFHALSPGHVLGDGPDVSGTVVVADIGLHGGEPSMFVMEDSDVVTPSRERRTHKWAAGSVLIVGGDEGMIGAAVMAGRSALHFGAGAVGVATSRPDICQTVAPELLAHHIDETGELGDRYDVLCIGPGLSEPRDDLLGHAGPVVLDAGSLHDHLDLSGRSHDTVLTPHAGELRRLDGAERTGAADLVTLVVKGNPTRVLGGGREILVTSGGPELATIGTGDVLSGMISALCARGVDGTMAAASAAQVHGRAAACIARDRTVTADLLVLEIGRRAGVVA